MLTGIGLLIAFSALQGAAVFLIAFLACRILGKTDRLSNLLSMSVSWLLWITLTIGGYRLLGGSGAIMEGFGLIMVLCLFATLSSLAYLFLWISRKGDG